VKDEIKREKDKGLSEKDRETKEKKIGGLRKEEII
jgi:hypothetical protein